jgi:hypothetical protein
VPPPDGPADRGTLDQYPLEETTSDRRADPLNVFYEDAGYMDPAIPGNLFRLRYDTAYNNRRPNRAEFFWAQGRPLGPGVPLPEPRVDYQDFSAYVEVAATQRLSGFVDVPWRLLNPEVNANANGFGDLNAGFRYAFIYRPDLVTTFQFRTYVPTGDAGRGLGTDHVSLEPAVLVYKPLTDRTGLEGEFRAAGSRSAAPISPVACCATGSGCTTTWSGPRTCKLSP